MTMSLCKKLFELKHQWIWIKEKCINDEKKEKKTFIIIWNKFEIRYCFKYTFMYTTKSKYKDMELQLCTGTQVMIQISSD